MKKALLFTAVAALLSACGDSTPSRSDTTDNPSNTVAPIATPAASATPAATATPSPTATPSSSATPDPSASPTPSAQPTATPDFGDKGACLVPVSPQATTEVSTGNACLACSVANPDAVTTATRDDVANTSVSLGIVPASGFADLSLKVNLLTEQDPTVDEDASALPVPDQPGFVVSFPDISLLTVAVAPTITVETMLGDEVKNATDYGFGFFDNLVLGLVGVDVNNAQVYLPVEADKVYDAVRFSVTGGLATVLLNIDVHAACIDGVGGSISGDFEAP